MASITPVWTRGIITNWVGVGYSDQDNLFPDAGDTYAIYNPFIGKATLDLREAHGAWIHPRIGKLRASTFSVAPKFRVFRHPDADGTTFDPAPYTEVDITTNTATLHNITTDAAAGDRSVSLESAASFAVGDLVVLGELAAGAGFEFNRIARIVTAVVHLEFPLRFAKDGTILEEGIRNKAIASTIWLPGGAFYELHVVNNLESIASGGEADQDGALVVQCPYEIYASDLAE
jgi:hypothetical protein